MNRTRAEEATAKLVSHAYAKQLKMANGSIAYSVGGGVKKGDKLHVIYGVGWTYEEAIEHLKKKLEART